MSIEIRRPVIPPDRPTLAERDLGSINPLTRFGQALRVSLEFPNVAAR
ncbi:hypothetical protein [Rhizobium rhizoryzae]|nr:hypothetical protein [Rhizobium rhizoryzae]